MARRMDRAYRKPAAQTGAVQPRGDTVDAAKRERQTKGKKRKKGAQTTGREWVLHKKSYARQQGKETKPDNKFTGRKRKDRF